MEFINSEAYVIYLRKSRTDNPAESVEEVLAKHETMLQDLAQRDLGGMIPEKCIFRENFISGETIEERPEMMRLLSAIEDPAIKAVLVVDPQRLSRGDLEDCGKVVNTFRYSNTNIITLQMRYDLSNKMHRKFFEQELMRGNDYLEYTKEILLRGRVASVQKGNYIGNIAPFGYDKAMIDGCHSLKPNDKADIVRMIFDMYVNDGKTFLQIAKHLDSMGVKPMKGEVWEKCSIRAILRNVHYAGYVKFGSKRTEKVYENGQLIKKRGIPADKDETIIAKGKQAAIVTQEIFDAAQEKLNNNPRAKWDAPLKNPLAGIFFCHKCGRAVKQHPYKHARDRFECGDRKTCKSKSVPMDEVFESLIYALEMEQLPMLETKLKNNDGNAAKIQQNQIQKMNEELAELRAQEEKQFELLEKGIYTEERFVKRNHELNVQIDEMKTRIYEAKKTLPKEVNYEERIVKLKDAIAALRNMDITPEAKNKLLKAIIERIELEYIRSEGKGKIIYALHIFLLI